MKPYKYRIKGWSVLFLFIIKAFFLFTTLLSQSSTNYTIRRSVFTQAGGVSMSANYLMADAIGQPSSAGHIMNTHYQIGSGFFGGVNHTTEVEQKEPPDMPKQFKLLQNYPNPFNPVTTIEYHLPQRAEVVLSVYDLLGHEIKSFNQGSMAPGVHKVQWDGRDKSGKTVASGIYVYCVEAIDKDSRERSYMDMKKMIFIK